MCTNLARHAIDVLSVRFVHGLRQRYCIQITYQASVIFLLAAFVASILTTGLDPLFPRYLEIKKMSVRLLFLLRMCFREVFKIVQESEEATKNGTTRRGHKHIEGCSMPLGPKQDQRFTLNTTFHL